MKSLAIPFLRPLLLALLLLLARLAAHAQGVGIGTAAPAASAALDISSTTRGLLPPRLTQAQRDAIASPATGLTIFNTTTGLLNVWDGASWLAYLLDTSNLVPVRFAFTGGVQTYPVPSGVTQLQVDLAGAAGGRGGASGGLGGRTQATLAVTPGEVLTIIVGGTPVRNQLVPVGGYNGGGQGINGNGGGGATDIRQGGAGLANRVLVAGGGGGGGSDVAGKGGDGGGVAGGDGTAASTATGGQGARKNIAGAGGMGSASPGNPGLGAQGGDESSAASGAGGGGYAGGGSGGGRAGGGGGSGLGLPSQQAVLTTGYQSGNGYAQLTPVLASLPAPVLDASNFINTPGDNLGNHTATQTLNLNGNTLAGAVAVLTPTTGIHNMLAVAYGSVGAAGTTLYASSGNYSLSHPASGVYTLTFTSANLLGTSLGNAPVLVSLYGGAVPGLITWAGGTGTVTVYTYAAGGSPADRGFSFAVFLP